MKPTAMSDRKKVHEGRNIKRFREMLQIKQDALAWELGEDWNQQKVSLLEQKEVIDEAILKQVSEILKIPVEAIRNFDEETALINIQNNYEGSNPGATTVVAYQKYEQCTFNPLDKIIELHNEKIALYERMVKEKDEMMARLERLLER